MAPVSGEIVRELEGEAYMAVLKAFMAGPADWVRPSPDSSSLHLCAAAASLTPAASPVCCRRRTSSSASYASC